VDVSLKPEGGVVADVFDSAVVDGDPLATGLPALDRALDGGVLPGSTVAVVSPPAVESDPLLYAAATVRPTRYLTTLRPPSVIEAALAAHGATAEGSSGVAVEAVDGSALLDAPESHLDGLPPESLLIVDPITEVEQGERKAYRAFLATVGRACRMTESVAAFHCPDTTPATLRRDLTLALADVVLDVDLRVDGRVDPRLTVTKARGRPLPERQFSLCFSGDGVEATPVDAPD